MNKPQKLNPNGELNSETTETRPVTPSINGVLTQLVNDPHMSDTLDSIVPISPTVDFQATPNSPILAPNARKAKLLHALASALGALVSWHKVELGGGRVGWALFFDERSWMVDPLTHELTPLGEK